MIKVVVYGIEFHSSQTAFIANLQADIVYKVSVSLLKRHERHVATITFVCHHEDVLSDKLASACVCKYTSEKKVDEKTSPLSTYTSRTVHVFKVSAHSITR